MEICNIYYKNIMKKCYKCQIFKNKEEFSKNKRYKDNLNDLCKLCKKKHNTLSKDKIKEYYFKNQTKNKEYNKQYYQNNKEQILEYSKQYYSIPDNQIQKQNYIKQYDSISINQIKRKEYTKMWKEKNPLYHTLYMKEKYKKDINFKIKNNLKSRFYHSIKSTKFTSIIKLVGCSIEELKLYLEQQFFPEMTWENHGLIWEIDHKKPCAAFDLTQLEEQQKCFHYTNLQPLFKTTEIAKSFGYNDQIGNRNKNKRTL